MLRIVIDEYLSQQVVKPSSEAFCQFTFVLGRNYQMLQQLAALFLGMLAGSVPVDVECLISVTGLICNSRRSSTGGDLGGLGGRSPQKFEVGAAHASFPPIFYFEK